MYQLLMAVYAQVSAATSVSLSFFTGGMVRAWASPAIPSIQGLDVPASHALSYAPLSKEEISWICKDNGFFFFVLPSFNFVQLTISLS